MLGLDTRYFGISAVSNHHNGIHSYSTTKRSKLTIYLAYGCALKTALSFLFYKQKLFSLRGHIDTTKNKIFHVDTQFFLLNRVQENITKPNQIQQNITESKKQYNKSQ